MSKLKNQPLMRAHHLDRTQLCKNDVNDMIPFFAD